MNIVQSIVRQSLNTFEEPEDRVPLELHGRKYPVQSRPRVILEQKTVPLPFRKLAEEIDKTLPYKLSPTRNASNVKDAIYRDFHRSCEQLQAMHQQLAEFMAAVFKCNVEIRTDWMESRRKHDLMQRKAKEWEAMAPAFEFQPPDVIRIELDAQPEFVIRGRIERALLTACEALVLKVVDILDLMSDMEVVGLVRWTSDTACRFHFFRHVLIEELKDTRRLTNTASRIVARSDGNSVQETKTTRRTENDVVHTHRHARHVHEVVAAQNNLLPAKHVVKPKRVEELLAMFPTWLQSLGRIITGTEVHRTIIEQDLRSENLTEADEQVEIQRRVLYHPDPAVVLGHYVLTGWGEEEVQPQK